MLTAGDVIGAAGQANAVLLRHPDACADFETEPKDLLGLCWGEDPSSANRTQSRIAASVGTSQQPRSAISTACSSVRNPPCSIDLTPETTAFVRP